MELRLTNIKISNDIASFVDDKAVEVNDKIFDRKFNIGLVHQVVSAYRNSMRAGTRAQKTRSEVRGGGIKPWRQKGTGRARAGSIRSPLWCGGGVTFAAKPQDFSQKVNKKMYRLAMCSVLSELIRQNRLILVSEFVLSSCKTKNLAKVLSNLDLKDALIIVDKIDDNLRLASNNLKNICICEVQSVNTLNLINFEKILFTITAFNQLEERLLKG